MPPHTCLYAPRGEHTREDYLVNGEPPCGRADKHRIAMKNRRTEFKISNMSAVKLLWFGVQTSVFVVENVKC